MQLLVWQVLSRPPSIGDTRAAKRVGRYLRKASVAWQGFPLYDPRPEELLCYTDAYWASDKTSRRSTSGGVVTLSCGVLNCWAKKQKSVAVSSWESELFAAITSGTRSLGIQSELMDLGYNCSVTASNHVGLRGSGCRKLWWRGNWSLKRWTLQ